MLDEIESKSVHKDKEGVDRGKISKAINETLQISTQQEIAIGTHFHGRHDTKTTPVFLPAYGEPLSCYFQVRYSYYQAAQYNRKIPIPVFSK